MKSKILLFILLIVLLGRASLNSASKVPGFENGPDSVKFKVPANFPAPVYDFKDNPVTRDGFMLGRLLFNDPILSRNRTISCASCHQVFAAFSHLDHPVSHGLDDCLGTRNAPALFNLAWRKDFMWDGGVRHIELSPLTAITNICEMDNDIEYTLTKLRQSPTYPLLFRRAFGSTFINSQRLLRALAQFNAMLISANSRYDHYMRNENNVSFTLEERLGYILFKSKCSSCHKEPLFTDGSFRSNGLDLKSEDRGRDSITHRKTDFGKFRVPSLRNIEKSAPYMHDGRFKTLAEVLAHYDGSVKNAENLDVAFRGKNALGIKLTSREQQLIITFLKTLTDHEFINDNRFR